MTHWLTSCDTSAYVTATSIAASKVSFSIIPTSPGVVRDAAAPRPSEDVSPETISRTRRVHPSKTLQWLSETHGAGRRAHRNGLCRNRRRSLCARPTSCRCIGPARQFASSSQTARDADTWCSGQSPRRYTASVHARVAAPRGHSVSAPAARRLQVPTSVHDGIDRYRFSDRYSSAHTPPLDRRVSSIEQLEQF